MCLKLCHNVQRRRFAQSSIYQSRAVSLGRTGTTDRESAAAHSHDELAVTQPKFKRFACRSFIAKYLSFSHLNHKNLQNHLQDTVTKALHLEDAYYMSPQVSIWIHNNNILSQLPIEQIMLLLVTRQRQWQSKELLETWKTQDYVGICAIIVQVNHLSFFYINLLIYLNNASIYLYFTRPFSNFIQPDEVFCSGGYASFIHLIKLTYHLLSSSIMHGFFTFPESGRYLTHVYRSPRRNFCFYNTSTFYPQFIHKKNKNKGVCPSVLLYAPHFINRVIYQSDSEYQVIIDFDMLKIINEQQRSRDSTTAMEQYLYLKS